MITTTANMDNLYDDLVMVEETEEDMVLIPRDHLLGTCCNDRGEYCSKECYEFDNQKENNP